MGSKCVYGSQIDLKIFWPKKLSSSLPEANFRVVSAKYVCQHTLSIDLMCRENPKWLLKVSKRRFCFLVRILGENSLF